jgi:hypothetical protein
MTAVVVAVAVVVHAVVKVLVTVIILLNLSGAAVFLLLNCAVLGM